MDLINLITLLFKARKDLEPVKKDFDAKHEKLMKEMPLFYDDRLNYIQPSLEAMIHAQVYCFI